MHEHRLGESRNGNNFYTGETMTSLLVHDRNNVVLTYILVYPCLTSTSVDLDHGVIGRLDPIFNL